MYRLLFLVALFLAALDLQAEASVVYWRGLMQITHQTSACVGSAQFRPDETWYSHYQPLASQVQAGNNHLGIGFFLFNHHTMVFNSSSQFNGNGNFTTNQIFYSDTKNYSGTFHLTQEPATVVPTTEFVVITGTISNFEGVANCTSTIRAIFVRDVPQ